MRLIRSFLMFSVYLQSNLMAQDNLFQEPDSTVETAEPRYLLREIIVTAPRSEQPIFRVPNAIHVLRKDQIQHAEKGLSLEEVLRSTPGVTVNNRQNLSLGDRISIRGIGSRASFGVRGIKVLLDDIPLTLPDGQSQLNNLDLSSIGTIEVWRGPSSALNGNASGGLINIQTELPTSQEFLFQSRIMFGDHGLQKWQGKVSGTIDGHAYLLNVSKFTKDGFREHSAAKSTTINAITKHKLSSSLRLNTAFSFVDSPYLLNPSSLSSEDAKTFPEMVRSFVKFQGAGKQIRQVHAGTTLTYKSEDSNQLRMTVYGLSRSLLNPIPGRIIDLGRKAGGIRTTFEKRFRNGTRRFRWNLGMDLEIQQDERLEFENLGLPDDQIATLNDETLFERLRFGDRLLDQSEQVWSLGTFSGVEYAIHSKLALTLSARYDRFRFKVDDDFLEDHVNDSGNLAMDKLSPMFGLVYEPRPFVSIYGNFSTGFQTPTTTELSNRPERAGGLNPSLQPEELKSYEIGFRAIG